MKTLTLVLLLGVILSSCVKNQELVPTNQQPPTTTNPPTAIGEFMSNAHATSGTVKVVEDAQDKAVRYLVFENFKTDAGPDLRVYLSEDTKTTGFVEVSKLDKTGTFTLTIPSSANLDKQRYVLIWCKQFSVLFGNAPLK